ncbi:MAG: hypothetical protein O3A07_02770 [Bacteroidetes bacterium]|nr:hypothetical protein [Bacteroidota bacterium]
MKEFFENINKKYEAFQNSISRQKHLIEIILALVLFLSTAYFKEILEAIHPIIYMALYVFSMTWFLFHAQGLKIFNSPLK